MSLLELLAGVVLGALFGAAATVKHLERRAARERPMRHVLVIEGGEKRDDGQRLFDEIAVEYAEAGSRQGHTYH